MIPAEEIRRRAADLGIPAEQIVRDHLISHVLDAPARLERQDFTFFGGTALCRTWCDDTRLSEDIDLLVDDHIQASAQLPGLDLRRHSTGAPNGALGGRRAQGGTPTFPSAYRSRFRHRPRAW